MITLKFSVLARYCCILAGLFLISAREAAPHSYSDNSPGEPICITIDNHNIYLIGPDINGNFTLTAKKSSDNTQPESLAYFFVILPDGNFTTLSRFDVTNNISTPFSKEIKLQYPAGQTSPLLSAHIQAWTMKKNDPDPPKKPNDSAGGITPIYQPSNTSVDQATIIPPSSSYLTSTYLNATESIKIGTSWSPWIHNDAYYYLIVSIAKTGNDDATSGVVTISNCMESDPTGFIMEEYFTYNPYGSTNLYWPYISANPIPLSTTSLIIPFNNLKPNQEVRHIYIKMRKNATPRESIAQYKAEIKYRKIDSDTFINTLTQTTACKTILLGSSPHDPNYKTVNHDSCTAKATGLLTYRIQFQNEGTGEARDVIVKDRLPAELFPYQIAVTQSSAPPQQLTTSVSSTGEATFTFSGINLSGTAQTIRRIYDYNETIGWVEFSCTAVCPDKGKSISNKADIIFVGNNDVAQPAIPTKAIITKADTTAFPGWNIINSESPCSPKHCCRIGWGRCKWYFCRFRECRTRKSANTIKSNY